MIRCAVPRPPLDKISVASAQNSVRGDELDERVEIILCGLSDVVLGQTSGHGLSQATFVRLAQDHQFANTFGGEQAGLYQS